MIFSILPPVVNLFVLFLPAILLVAFDRSRWKEKVESGEFVGSYGRWFHRGYHDTSQFKSTMKENLFALFVQFLWALLIIAPIGQR